MKNHITNHITKEDAGALALLGMFAALAVFVAAVYVLRSNGVM